MLAPSFSGICWRLGQGQRVPQKAEEGCEHHLPLPASSLCRGLVQEAGVAVKGAEPNVLILPAIQNLPRSLTAAEINAPTRQMSPERIGASNCDKWWRLWPTFLPCKSHLHFPGCSQAALCGEWSCRWRCGSPGGQMEGAMTSSGSSFLSPRPKKAKPVTL